MRSIREIALKIKAHSRAAATAILRDWGLFIVVILAVTASFGLGRLSVLKAPPGPILVQNTASAATPGRGATLPIGGSYVGAKSGDLYYFPWCAGALKIAPEDRRWFEDEQAAEKAGYRPAGNCRGMPEK